MKFFYISILTLDFYSLQLISAGFDAVCWLIISHNYLFLLVSIFIRLVCFPRSFFLPGTSVSFNFFFAGSTHSFCFFFADQSFVEIRSVMIQVHRNCLQQSMMDWTTIPCDLYRTDDLEARQHQNCWKQELAWNPSTTTKLYEEGMEIYNQNEIHLKKNQKEKWRMSGLLQTQRHNGTHNKIW